MGSDDAIVESARVSYSGEGSVIKRSNTGLINYLVKHNHVSPLEHCVIKLRVKLPIFVARQWIKHNIYVNEISGRYTKLSSDVYIPEASQIQPQSKSNKQGRDGSYTDQETNEILKLIQWHREITDDVYNTLLDTDLTRELARGPLSVNNYTEWVMTTNLRDLLYFIKARTHHSAQYEIRQYADMIAMIVADWVPIAWQAFKEYQLTTTTLTQDHVNMLIAKYKMDREDFDV